jgi:nucleoside-diphosphate-sugar epimerase
VDDVRQPRFHAPWDLPSDAAYDFVEGDVRDEAARAEALEDVDTVVRLAAVTDAPGRTIVFDAVRAVCAGRTVVR